MYVYVKSDVSFNQDSKLVSHKFKYICCCRNKCGAVIGSLDTQTTQSSC